jgi:sulfate/thiosulfate transport system ATP-binding protein
MSIEVRNITKTFGKFVALDDVNLTVGTGELVALLGPSGSGKTTLLRVIAGLESPDATAAASGRVLFHGDDVGDRHVASRRVGFVFQHYALFRHMTVFDNVAFGLRAMPWRQRPPKLEIRERVLELLRLVQLEGLQKRYPAHLSGGQRQRVALARALAVRPKVLLLDEPFGALDAKVRRELRRWLRKLHDDMGITSVFVTHDEEEALEVADRVAVMNKGKIEQVGTPEEVYEHPANPFVYHFLGNVNLFHGGLDGGRLQVGSAALRVPESVDTYGNGAEISRAQSDPSARRAVAFVRPHDLEVAREGNGDSISATIEHVSFAGPFVNVYLTRRDTGETVEAAVPRERYRELALKASELVHLTARRARIFPDDYSI